MRPQNGILEHYNAIYVDNNETDIMGIRDAASEHRNAVSSRPLRICVGKMLTDVTNARRTEHSVGHSVGNYVSVAVPTQTCTLRNLYPAQAERTVLAERMYVESRPDAHRHDQAAYGQS